jgi:hypothetical protein
MIRVNESDPILRPSMTTSNQIITAVLDSVAYLPLEAIFGNDTMTYVYRTNGTKQIVVTGEMNDNYRIIEQGLNENDEVYLSTPKNAEKFKLVGEEYIPVIKERAEKKRAEEEKRKEEAKQKEEMRKMRMNMRGNMRGAPGGNPVQITVPAGGADKSAKTDKANGDKTNKVDMSNLPKEVQDAIQKGDTAAVKKYFKEQQGKKDDKKPKDSDKQKPDVNKPKETKGENKN